MKREKQIGARVSFPASYFMQIEDCWKHEAGGCHRALTFQDFLAVLIGYGMEAYLAQLRPAAAPLDSQSGNCKPEADQADPWDFDSTESDKVLRYR
ncbi:hypothetical protein LQZ19_05165 [Treponema primitia]|uniref:hypothetical protein n=1 Tax=Treponema primitia TaxID=88058 RepID=UPI003981895B